MARGPSSLGPQVIVESFGIEQQARALDKIEPTVANRFVTDSLKECAKLAAKNVQHQVRQGGGPPIAGRLTSRSGLFLDSIFHTGSRLSSFFGTPIGFYKVHQFGIGRWPQRDPFWPTYLSVRNEFGRIVQRIWDQAIARATNYVPREDR